MNKATVENYGWKSADPEESHSYLLPTVLDILRRNGVHSLLDIGTGNGAALPFWLDEGIKVAAMEPDEKGYRYSKKHSGADVKQLGVGERLPIEWINSFDAVVSLEVVEHLFDPSALVKTSKEALRKGGLAIISTPYHGYFKNLALTLAGKWDFHHHPNRVGGHIKFFSKGTLRHLFEVEGFEEISFKGVGRFPLVWKSMVMVFRKR